MWPLLAGFGRFLLTVGGGWLVVHVFGADLAWVFVCVAASFVLFGLSQGVALWRGITVR